MPSLESGYFLRIILIISKCCTDLMESLLMFRILHLKPADYSCVWNLDSFLLQNKSALYKKLDFGKRRENRMKLNIYYPPSGCGTNLERWDLQMAVFVLREICDLEPAIVHTIDNIKNLRNDICHQREPSLSEGEFQIYMGRIENAVHSLLQYVGNDDLTARLDREMEDIKNGMFGDIDPCIHLHKLYMCCIREMLTEINDNTLATRQTTEKLQEDIDRNFKAIKSELTRLSGKGIWEEIRITIANTHVIMTVANGTEGKENTAAMFILSLIQTAFITDLSDDDDIQIELIHVTEILRQLFNELTRLSGKGIWEEIRITIANTHVIMTVANGTEGKENTAAMFILSLIQTAFITDLSDDDDIQIELIHVTEILRQLFNVCRVTKVSPGEVATICSTAGYEANSIGVEASVEEMEENSLKITLANTDKDIDNDVVESTLLNSLGQYLLNTLSTTVKTHLDLTDLVISLCISKCISSGTLTEPRNISQTEHEANMPGTSAENEPVVQDTSVIFSTTPLVTPTPPMGTDSIM